jgi:hypothetical protein
LFRRLDMTMILNYLFNLVVVAAGGKCRLVNL